MNSKLEDKFAEIKRKLINDHKYFTKQLDAGTSLQAANVRKLDLSVKHNVDFHKTNKIGPTVPIWFYSGSMFYNRFHNLDVGDIDVFFPFSWGWKAMYRYMEDLGFFSDYRHPLEQTQNEYDESSFKDPNGKFEVSSNVFKINIEPFMLNYNFISNGFAVQRLMLKNESELVDHFSIPVTFDFYHCCCVFDGEKIEAPEETIKCIEKSILKLTPNCLWSINYRSRLIRKNLGVDSANEFLMNEREILLKRTKKFFERGLIPDNKTYDQLAKFKEITSIEDWKL